MLMNVYGKMVAVQNYVTTQQEVSFAVAFSQAMRSQRTASTVQVS